MKFDEELKKGNFLICKCSKCNQTVWPPQDFCNLCFGETIWKNSNKIGKILEFSKDDGGYFCLVEIEDKIRILGRLGNGKAPEINSKVKIEKCGIKDGNYSFELSFC